MRILLLLLGICFLSNNLAFSQSTFGYSTDPPVSSSFHTSNELFGQKINLPTRTQVTSIGVNMVIFSNTQFQGAIYSDDSGKPGQLLASTNNINFLTNLGINTIPLITPAILPAGDYWLLKVTSAGLQIGNDGGATVPIYRTPLTFGQSLPDPFPGTATLLADPTYSIYMIGTPMPIQAPIPTMSQWGLMIFGLLIINLGVFFVQRSGFA